jgi:DNA-binding transcriptional MerR regulator
MSKSKDAFRTISEVADWLETPAHVLRFWESKFTQVKPVKRAGGRRYYRPADMKLLGGIKNLLHDDGLTIKGVQKLLREHGVKHVAALSPHLDDDLVDEADFVENVETLPDEGAAVLAFPSQRTASEIKTPAPAKTPEPPAAPPQVEGAAAETPPAPEQQSEPASVPVTEPEPEPQPAPAHAASTETDLPPTDQPPLADPEEPDQAFGGDVPAFMRRSPPSETDENAVTAIENTENDAAGAAPAKPSVTIDPVAKLVPMDAEESPPVETDPAPEVIAQDDIQTSAQEVSPDSTRATDPSPGPKDRTSGEDTAHGLENAEAQPTQDTLQAAPVPEEPVEEPEAETADAVQVSQPAPPSASEPETQSDAAPETTEPPAPQRPLIDVPALAKVAPELDSFEAEPGLLDILPGTQRISPELAEALKPHLEELRALRTRMQG